MKPVVLNKNNLWNGCILASVAHAIMVAHYPELSYEHSWDNGNYNVLDSSGGRGTITFTDHYVVGAFRNDNVTRDDIPTALDFFTGAPKEVIELAQNETLEYLLEEDEDGTASPSITTSFWGDNNTITSIDNIVRMIRCGGYILERQFMDNGAAVEAWRDYYEMTYEQVKLLNSVYLRKLNNPNGKITLTKSEIKTIGTDNHEGLSESRTSFEELNIYWE